MKFEIDAHIWGICWPKFEFDQEKLVLKMETARDSTTGQAGILAATISILP